MHILFGHLNTCHNFTFGQKGCVNCQNIVPLLL